MFCFYTGLAPDSDRLAPKARLRARAGPGRADAPAAPSRQKVPGAAPVTSLDVHHCSGSGRCSKA